MLLCPKCKALMKLNRKTDQMECKRPACGHNEPKGKEENITTRKRIDREIVITEGIEGTLPSTKIMGGAFPKLLETKSRITNEAIIDFISSLKNEYLFLQLRLLIGSLEKKKSYP